MEEIVTPEVLLGIIKMESFLLVIRLLMLSVVLTRGLPLELEVL